MLHQISYSLYSAKSLYDLAKQIHQIVLESHPNHPMLAPFLDTLQNSMDKAVSALGKRTANPLTSQIKGADSNRDDAFVAFRDHVRAGLRRLNDNYRQASEQINQVLEENDLRLYVFGYAEQSAALARLFTELEKAENQQALGVLQAKAWVQELKEAQQVFEQLYAKRIETGAEAERITETEAKKELTAALQILVQTLGVLEAMGSPESIFKTIKQLNILIDQAQATVRR